MVLQKPRIPVLNWGNPLTRGLIFDVPLFEGGGNFVKDIARGVVGTPSNVTWEKHLYGTNGKFVVASSPYIDFGRPSHMILNRGFSIMSLTNWTAHALELSILSFSEQGYYFRIDTAGKYDFLESQTAGVLTATTATTANTWNSGAVTVDNASTANVAIYTNGRLDGSTTSAVTYNTSSSNLRISADWNNGAGVPEEFFDGKLGYVRVWNRVLNPYEIKLLHEKPWMIYKTPSRFMDVVNVAAGAVAARKFLPLLGVN